MKDEAHDKETPPVTPQTTPPTIAPESAAKKWKRLDEQAGDFRRLD
jgi:hypothetical protein